MEPFKQLKTGEALRCQGTCNPKNKSTPGTQCTKQAELTTGYCSGLPPHKCMPADGVLPLGIWPEAWIQRGIQHPEKSLADGITPKPTVSDLVNKMKQ